MRFLVLTIEADIITWLHNIEFMNEFFSDDFYDFINREKKKKKKTAYKMATYFLI